jgi:hypothetical protein
MAYETGPSGMTIEIGDRIGITALFDTESTDQKAAWSKMTSQRFDNGLLRSRSTEQGNIPGHDHHIK